MTQATIGSRPNVPLVRAALSVTLAAALLVTAVAAGIASLRAVVGRVDDALIGSAPDLLAASSVPASRATQIVAADGTTIAWLRPAELHVPIEADALPGTLAEAVVAAEDASFWEHRGFDLSGIVRAALENARAGEVEQGGSTITQQLVKNLFTEGERTLQRKADELRTAIAIEREYSKDEILTAYLNTTYFGDGAIGAEAAARTYFRKSAHELDVGEAALLAGVIAAPGDYNPRTAPDEAEARRQYVLDRLGETGTLPSAAIAEARRQPPAVHPPRPTDARYPYFVDFVRRWLLDVAGLDPSLLFAGGLRVETSLDPELQDRAIAAAAARLPMPFNPEAAVVVLDPGSGEVRALVGGRDWEGSQVNLALGRLGGGGGRQAGSAFKPFALAAALQDGWSPRDKLPAPAEYQPATASEPIHNYSRRGYGTVTLAEATRRSINTSYTVLVERLGAGRVAEVAGRLGLPMPEPHDAVPTIALGPYEVSPVAMARAYGAFAADGRLPDARPVRRVVRSSGEVLLDAAAPVPGEQILEPEVARLVTQTLQGVITSGTGTGADIGRPAAGKTGTSDQYTNAWFAGYTPQLVTAVWVGFADGAVPMRDINGVRAVTGGSIPALLWRDVMTAAHAGLPVEPFPPAPQRPSSTTTTTARPAPISTAPPPTTTTTPPPPPTTTPAPSTTTTAPPPPTTTTTSTTSTTQPPTTTTTQPPTTTTTTERSVPPPLGPTTTTTTTPTTTTTSTTAPPATTTTTEPPATTTTTTEPPPATTTTTEPPPTTTTTTSTTTTSTATSTTTTSTTPATESTSPRRATTDLRSVDPMANARRRGATRAPGRRRGRRAGRF